MLRSKWGAASVIIGYVAGLISVSFLPDAVALVFPILGTMLGSTIRQAELKVARLAAERDAALAQSTSAQSQSLSNQTTQAIQNQGQQRTVNQATSSSAASSSNKAPDEQTPDLGPEWISILEYIGTIEDMVLLEGEKNNLDNEIVQRTLSLLVRLNRIIPQLVVFNNGDINHKIQRLVLKDLNGAINPFINLSGEAKRQNRRILLNSLKDIDNQISTYTSFIEQKDLMELKNKAELIHQRYGLRN
ncbi:hypothetical protein [Cohnella sp.]|uniref:hypothetical protein n=1 Tax=Cohnella sp. TaxID=1883426 RepID=UPI003562E606